MNTHRKVFILLSIILLSLILLYAWLTIKVDYQRMLDTFKTSSKQQQVEFNAAQKSTEIQMLQIAIFVANDSKVQQLFLSGKKAVALEGGCGGGKLSAQIRTSLYEQVHLSREVLAKQFGFRQLQFHFGPGSLSFLRVHQPSKFGDRMDRVRYTIVVANAEKKNTMGFETGRVVSGIRGATPVYAKDKTSNKKIHVGTVEAGTSFASMLSLYHENRPWLNATVLLNYDHLKRNVWADFLAKMVKKNGIKKGFYVEGTTSPLIDYFLSRSEFTDILATSGQHLFYDYEKIYNITTFPLRDFLGKTDLLRPDAGTIVIWEDVSSQVEAYYNSVSKLIFYGFILFINIEAMLFFALKFMTQQLQKELDKTHEQELASEKARLIAEESSRLKTQFLNNISHELRTPLNAIMALGKLLGDSSLDLQQQGLIEKINISSTNLLKIIDEILLLSESESHQSENNKLTPFDPVKLLHKLRGYFIDSAKEQGVKLNLVVPDDLHILVNGYPVKIELILKQLLGNAIKFSTDGEITVSLVVINITDTGVILEFMVSDQGVGIPNDQLKLIFHPFQQVDGSKTRHYGGAGLGLSIARKLCQQMGGDIVVKSVIGEGSCFSFKLKLEVNTVNYKDLDPVVADICIDTKKMSDGLLPTEISDAEMIQLLDSLELSLAKMQPIPCKIIADKIKCTQCPSGSCDDVGRLIALIETYRFLDAQEVVVQLKQAISTPEYSLDGDDL